MTTHSAEVAFPVGTDPVELSRTLYRARDTFVETGAVVTSLRPVVAESWRRSLSQGLDPEYSTAPIELDTQTLAAIREQHPLSLAMPVVRRLLVESAAEAGLLVAVSDAAGRLLWVEGAARLRALAEGMSFVEGANWSEGSAGTNAPGTALAIDRAVQIFGAEHLSRPVTPWSCSAAPIHDPDTGAILGVLDLTGGPEVVAPQSLALVRATVAAVEAELRIDRLSRSRLRVPSSRPRAVVRPSTSFLRVLGERGAALGHGSAASRLSARHSEILLLLHDARDGLSAAELAVALSDSEHPAVTVRAELSRLRSLIGPLQMQSRPYRLHGPLDVDADLVRAALRRGELRRAVADYRGPVLPHSTAPGVVALRVDLHEEIRATLLERGDPDALLTFADTPHSHTDYEIWAAALTALPAGSPRLAQVRSHVDQLEIELA